MTTLLKKTGLDSADVSNIRPISNLSVMSKVVERAIVSQLTEYLSADDFLPCLQSASRKRHSTETAMLRVWSGDVIMMRHTSTGVHGRNDDSDVDACLTADADDKPAVAARMSSIFRAKNVLNLSVE